MKTCELFLCFVTIVRVRAIVLTSLFSLFYVTGECHSFLHRGWAQISGNYFNSSQSANMWVPWNILLKAYVNKDNLHAFQSRYFRFFLSRSTKMSNGLLWWDSSTLKRVYTIKTCVAVFIFSRKISGLLRSLSVGTLFCRASLIKRLLFIGSFTPLYNSARRGKSHLWKRNSDRHSWSPNHRS